MGYGSFYVICPRASSQSVTPLASPREVSLKSDNRLLSYDQKRFLISWPSAILNFRGPIMGSLYRTSYKSSMETIAVNCLVFEKKIAFLYTSLFAQKEQHKKQTIKKQQQTTKQTDERTDERTDGQHRCVKAPLVIASGALTSQFGPNGRRDKPPPPSVVRVSGDIRTNNKRKDKQMDITIA